MSQAIEHLANMTLEQIEDATDTGQKTLRAYLRRNFKRESERKGSRWGDAKKGYILNKRQTAALMSHFTSVEEDAENEEVAS